MVCCGQWGVRDVPLQFTKKWVGGDAQFGRRDASGGPVTIRLRLANAEAFANEFNTRAPFGLTCHEVRLLYRNTPDAAPKFLTTRWADSTVIWSPYPQVCLYAGLESSWNLLIVRERGELPLDIDGRLVLVSGAQDESRAEVAVTLLRIRRSSEDFDREGREGLGPFIVARSQWLPLRR